MSRAQQIEQDAALWVVRREEPSWSVAEQAELDAWLAESDAHKVAFWRLECGWRDADRIASLGAPLQSAAQRFDAPCWWQPYAVAASLLLVAAVFLLQLPGLHLSGPSNGSPVQVETAIGGHKVVSLDEGSRIELNTDTAIRTAVDEERRAVWLDRGEAFFDVARRGGREFVIYAGARTIKVLGTKFSVRRSGREVVVAVLEGRVRVEDAPSTGPDRHATVTAGDVAIARGESTLVTRSGGAVRQELAWRNGQLLFDETSLGAAAAQFNRYNRKRLVIGDPEVARLTVGGSFRARNVDAFARMLEQAYGLDVRDDAGRIILSTGKFAHQTPSKPPREDPVSPSNQLASTSIVRPCRLGGADCALIPPSPVVRQVVSVPEAKAIRDARNWAVLYKHYPPRALAAQEEGLVGFLVKIDSGGNPTACSITHTSGHPLLDLETCQLIMGNATFKPPADTSRSQQRTYEGVVNWKLPTTPLSAVPAIPKRIAEAEAPEKLICRRITQTGSNVAAERKCMTQSEWRNMSDDSKEYWNRGQGRKSCVGTALPCD